jgi:hypothetical protein
LQQPSCQSEPGGAILQISDFKTDIPDEPEKQDGGLRRLKSLDFIATQT